MREAARSAWRRRVLLRVRLLAILVLLAILAVSGLGTSHDMSILVMAMVSCAWIVLFVRGVQALRWTDRVRHHAHAPQLSARAAPPSHQWVGLALAVVGALILASGRVTIGGIRQDWSALGGVMIFGSWYFIWRGAFAISMDGSLQYVSLFGGYRRIRLEEIDSSRRFAAGASPTLPTRRIEVYPADGGTPIVINFGIFEKRDVDAVVRWLGQVHERPGAADQR